MRRCRRPWTGGREPSRRHAGPLRNGCPHWRVLRFLTAFGITMAWGRPHRGMKTALLRHPGVGRSPKSWDGFPLPRERRVGVWLGYFHSNRSCRLRPAHQVMKMALSSLPRVDGNGRGWVPAPASAGAGSARERRWWGASIYFRTNDTLAAGCTHPCDMR